MKYLRADIFLEKSVKFPIIDVRSTIEFEEGHIPGAINIPLFDNEERKIVGTLYKQQGRDQAVMEALRLSGPKLADKIQRWEPGFRLAYTNYTDDNEDGKYLRYRASLAYDIAHCRLTPEAGFEVYHDLDQSNIYKYRTKMGFDYKLSRKLALTAAYKFDFYKTKEKNRHILDVGIKIKL